MAELRTIFIVTPNLSHNLHGDYVIIKISINEEIYFSNFTDINNSDYF
jgi:hypothetical protein